MPDLSALDVIVDSWRQTFHLCPPHGLINDPNGLIFWQGAYHVFYQWNPSGCDHQNKHWAHVRSTDLLHWEWLPFALAPDRPYDAQGCYSGCAMDVDGQLFLMYTGNVRDAAGGRSSYQCLARSRDGVRFEKLGPVIDGAPEGYTGHFRDPKVWREGQAWYAVIGAQRDDLAGTVVLAKSTDLVAWQLIGELIEPAPFSYMVECPDLFRLDERAVLICCQQTAEVCADGVRRADTAGYLVGEVDLAAARLAHTGFRPLDRGFDFYAPQTLLDASGRRLLIGWMGLPTQPETPTVASGWTHCLTMPRELTLEDGRLLQRPLRELARLRGEVIRMPDTALQAGAAVSLPQVPGGVWELDVLIDAPAGADCADCADCADWVLHLFDSSEQSLRLVCEGSPGRLALIRNCPAAGQFDERKDCEIDTAVTRVQVFVDRSSVEIFVNDGAEVFTTRCYPASEPMPPRWVTTHPLRLRDLCLWPLQPQPR